MKKIVKFIIGAALIMGAVGCNTSSKSAKTYNIKFFNDDQTLLQEVVVKDGDVPQYTGETPKKEQTAEFTYTFKDWTPQIVAAHSDANYTATYESAKRKYTITFNNDDGTLLSSTLVEYGTIPTPPADPTKVSSARYDYEFAGWDKEIVAVTGDETYTATYSRTVRSFLITFLDEDQTTVLKSERFDYGETPTCDEPSKASTESKVYEFAGWSPEVVPVVNDATYVATYTESVRKYIITFLDDDEETVLKSTQEEYGTMPSCEEPKKASTDSQSFLFSGWTPEVVSVVGDATYVATYQATARLYEIKFVDDEGNVIDIQNLEYGVSPVVPDTAKADDEEFTYTFTGWDKEIVAVAGDTVYTASYSKIRIGYNFNKDNLESYVGASLYDLDAETDATWVMGVDRGGTLIGTQGKYLQYQPYEAHTYRMSLPKIDFRNLKTLSSSVKMLCWQNDLSIAFTEEEARAKSGITLTGSQQAGRIEVITTAENSVTVKLNINPESSIKISKTFDDEDIYKGDKSIEIYITNSGGDKYFTIDEFAPRRDFQYQINKSRVIRVNDTYSWAACYLQMVIGDTFLPLGSYVYRNLDAIKLYRNDELVTTAARPGQDCADGFSLSEKHFAFGSGGDGTSNWMARILSDSWAIADIIQNGDVLVMNGIFEGKNGTAAQGYEINFDLTFRIITIENGYQSSKTGYKFTLL